MSWWHLLRHSKGELTLLASFWCFNKHELLELSCFSVCIHLQSMLSWYGKFALFYFHAYFHVTSVWNSMPVIIECITNHALSNVITNNPLWVSNECHSIYVFMLEIPIYWDKNVWWHSKTNHSIEWDGKIAKTLKKFSFSNNLSQLKHLLPVVNFHVSIFIRCTRILHKTSNFDMLRIVNVHSLMRCNLNNSRETSVIFRISCSIVI